MNPHGNASESFAAAADSSPRSTLRAVLLTLLMPGLGHVYCGELIAGLAWAALGSFSGVISLWALATHPSHLAITSVPMWIVTLLSVSHVILVAKRCPEDYQLRSFNRSYVYLLLLCISSCGVVGHGLLVRTNIVAAYVTPSSDMEPTLHPGDRFLVDKTAYRQHAIAIGDLVVFKDPASPERTFIKRVAAHAGSSIEVKQGKLRVDGKAYECNGDANHDLPPFGPVIVPEYNVFVLGDNLGNSKDSRHFGPVPIVGITGKPTFLFWSKADFGRFGSLK